MTGGAMRFRWMRLRKSRFNKQGEHPWDKNWQEHEVDIRNVFKEISEQLLAEFRKTAQVSHPGGKGSLREDAFGKFLSERLPARYGVGRGEVITPENRVSGQLDIVIYDRTRGPELITSASH